MFIDLFGDLLGGIWRKIINRRIGMFQSAVRAGGVWFFIYVNQKSIFFDGQGAAQIILLRLQYFFQVPAIPFWPFFFSGEYTETNTSAFANI